MGVHALCAIEDHDAKSVQDNLTCEVCWNKKTPGKKDTNSKDNADACLASPAKNTRSAAQKMSPPAKCTRRSSASQPQPLSSSTKAKRPRIKKATTASSKRLKKTAQQKSFLLTADKRKPCPLTPQRVAFDLDDDGYGAEQLCKHFGGKEAISHSLTLGQYLLGTISRVAKGKRSPLCYTVEWEDVNLGETTIEVSVLIPAINLSSKLKKEESKTRRTPTARSAFSKTKANTINLFGQKIRDALLLVEDGEEGIPEDSDIEVMDDTEESESEKAGGFHLEDLRKYASGFQSLATEEVESPKPASRTDSFRWSSEATLHPPINLSEKGKSFVKPELTGSFASPLLSFLAFIPSKVFKGIAIYSNAYAHRMIEKSGKNEIAGGKWTRDITLTEVMNFFGIRFHMTLRPTPGNDYTVCWGDQQWHPYTTYMSLRRFQQIRAVLHFNCIEEDVATPIGDALFKVRPLLNCLKITFPSYLSFGDNFALDEASVASRSKYGSDVIFYNPTKPGGKYHFRFYLLCCSSSYACIRLRMHTKNDSDYGDARLVEDNDDENDNNGSDEDESNGKNGRNNGEENDRREEGEEKDEASISSHPPKIVKKLLSLVVDMCKPLFGSGCIVNMDNYYTSPEAAVALRQKGVYIRGTCRPNRIGFPQAVRFTNTEANNQDRGTIKRMVDSTNHLAAYGWVDGNPVHFLTSADGTGSTNVKRRVGRKVSRVKAPIAIKRYNENMHAVDRHDQLRETFSLSRRHGFKKYYLKIAMGLLDMAVVNAWIHYKLVNKDKCNKKNSRYEFMRSLADSLLVTDWTTFGSTASAKEGEKIFKSLFSEDRDDVDLLQQNAELLTRAAHCCNEPEGAAGVCTPIAVNCFLRNKRSKKKGLSCQVCAFEGRGQGNTRDVVICTRHRIRLCTIPRYDKKKLVDSQGNEITDLSWRAPDTMSCWNKAHEFYIPKGLFGEALTPVTEEEMESLRMGGTVKFQTVRTGCLVYQKKHEVLGSYGRNQGRKKKDSSNRMKKPKKRNRILEGGSKVQDAEMRILPQQAGDATSSDNSISSLEHDNPRDSSVVNEGESVYDTATQGGDGTTLGESAWL